ASTQAAPSTAPGACKTIFTLERSQARTSGTIFALRNSIRAASAASLPSGNAASRTLLALPDRDTTGRVFARDIGECRELGNRRRHAAKRAKSMTKFQRTAGVAWIENDGYVGAHLGERKRHASMRKRRQADEDHLGCIDRGGQIA